MRLVTVFGDIAPILVAAFVAAALISLVLTPLVRRAALRVGTIDHPDHRRVNTSPIPRAHPQQTKPRSLRAPRRRNISRKNDRKPVIRAASFW